MKSTYLLNSLFTYYYQVEQHSTSTADVNPTSSASPCLDDESIQSSTSLWDDELVQSSTSFGSPTTSAHQKHRQCSLAASKTPDSHSKSLQPTVVLRHWNGVSDRSPCSVKSAKVKEAKNGEFSRQKDATVSAVRRSYIPNLKLVKE